MPLEAGERVFIQSLRKRIAQPVVSEVRAVSARSQSRRRAVVGTNLALGVGDDCAILRPLSGHEILVTTDFSLETVHFRRDWHSPESVGHRCLARGLSDLAAMGAWPIAAFLSLALPVELVESRSGHPSWRDRFFDGLLALAQRYDVPLAGGDTAQSPLIAKVSRRRGSGGPVTGLALADIVLVGSAPRNRAIRRSTAKAGDRIYVSGYLGGAAAELSELVAHPGRFRTHKAANVTTAPERENSHPHLFPEPRIAVGAWLLKNHRASSAIDISDGLSTDLHHLCEESNLAAAVNASAIPIHPIALRKTGRNPQAGLELALNGGEDYELLFTASPNVKVPRRIAGVPIACIGEMRSRKSRGARVLLIEIVGSRERMRPLPAGGWEHFA
ncbi:MAG: thiamine-phosphate kinase [Acidobacteriaceae bacterium]